MSFLVLVLYLSGFTLSSCAPISVETTSKDAITCTFCQSKNPIPYRSHLDAYGKSCECSVYQTITFSFNEWSEYVKQPNSSFLCLMCMRTWSPRATKTINITETEVCQNQAYQNSNYEDRYYDPYKFCESNAKGQSILMQAVIACGKRCNFIDDQRIVICQDKFNFCKDELYVKWVYFIIY